MAAGAEQVIDLTKQVQRTRNMDRRGGFGTRPIGPGGRDQGARTIRKDKGQDQPTLTGHLAEDFEILTFKSMPPPHNPYKLRDIDVGSVSCFPSMP